MQIFLAAGGTGGHVIPGLAVAAALQRAMPDVSLLFVGGAHGCEQALVPRSGYDLATLPAEPFFGVGMRGKLRALRRFIDGLVAARALVLQHRPDLVIGFGGYTSAAVLVAARRARVSTAIVEPNAYPGLTNRWLGRWVDRAYLGCDEARSYFPANVRQLVGVPIPRSIATTARRPCTPSAAAPRCILVVGGQLGSSFLNRHVPSLLADVQRGGVALSIRHQVGRRDVAAVAAAYRERGVMVELSEFIDDMAGAYAAADFAITTAGAVTLAELEAVGLPALVVPLGKASENHQAANARALAQRAGVMWVTEAEWNQTDLAQRLHRLLSDSNALQLAAARMRSEPNTAAERIAADAETLIKRLS